MRLSLFITATLLMLTQSALGVTIANFTHFAAEREKILTGTGLVVGLKGTGDGTVAAKKAQDLKMLLVRMGYPTKDLDISNLSNIAVVSLRVVVPGGGAYDGDHLDVQIVSTGNATSLKGGRLFVSPLLSLDGKPASDSSDGAGFFGSRPFAIAQGPVQCDAQNDTAGMVHDGAIVDIDLPTRYVDDSGCFILRIDAPSATPINANNAAKAINQASGNGEKIATVLDDETILVQIPAAHRANPAPFISEILQLRVQLQSDRTARETAVSPKTTH